MGLGGGLIEEETNKEDNTTQPQPLQPNDHINKNVCKTCHTLIKCKDGRHTCTHACAALGYEFGADTVNKSLAIVDELDRMVAMVAYVRGIEDHLSKGQDDRIDELEMALFLTETADPPSKESSMEDSGPADTDNVRDGPDTPPRRRLATDTDYRIHDETSDSDTPEYTT